MPYWACSIPCNSMAFSFRGGPVRPFVEVRDYDNGAGTTMQVGVTTYRKLDDGDEAYSTTYLEWGGRSDHLQDAIASLRGQEPTERRVSTASATDQRYVGTTKQNQLEVETVDVIAETAS